MKVSQFLVKTLREVPAAAEIPSHIFLLRGGYIKQLASGLYSILPLGKRILNKIEKVIREEMEKENGQEMDLPLVHPAELWQESQRYNAIGDELVRFKDRGKHDMVLAMTHEEAVTDLARYVISSYKQLPFMVYQFKLKFRDEPRARGGLIRVREFIMKDAYSFHSGEKDLDEYYDKMRNAYSKIFSRLGITPIIVQSDTGIMGGKIAHEFMLEAPSGEDNLILSEDGKYSANQEIALFDREAIPQEAKPAEKVSTPGRKSIEEICEYLKVPPNQTMKTLVYTYHDGMAVICVRGDLNISEIKVRNFLQTPQILLSTDEDMIEAGLIPGFASPLEINESGKIRILVDESVRDGNNFVAGANEKDFHIKNINFPRDFKSQNIGDFAQAEQGHKCINSDSRLKAVKGIEIGNIFKLGTKFSQTMKAEFLNEKGRSQPLTMGCYGIGVGRLMAAVIENSHDNFGPIWPKEITPFHVHLLNIGMDPEIGHACTAVFDSLREKNIEVLFDDRDERPGVKFKDADLWGIPIRLGISKKTLAENACELKYRDKKDFELVKLEKIPELVLNFYNL